MKNLFKIILLSIAFFLCAVNVFGADQNIYITDETDGSEDGSITHPYDTFADINWTTGGSNSIFDWVDGGDDVYINLAKADSWREQLTVGTSGASGHPITIQAYGDGADPIINGSDVVETWTATTESFTYTLDAAQSDDDFNFRMQVPSGKLTKYGSSVRIKIDAPAAADLVITGVFLGEKASAGDAYDMESGTITQITFNTGSNNVTVTQGETKYSDWMTYAFDPTEDYLISVGLTSVSVKTTGATGLFSYYKANSEGDAGTANVTSYSNLSAWYMVISEFVTKVDNGWDAALTTEPQVVWMDGTLGDEKTAVDDFADEYDWHWGGNRLYAYSDTDPDSAYDDPGVEATQRVGTYATGKDYITFDGLKVEKAGNTATSAYSMGFNNCDHITFKNMVFDDACNSHINMWGGCDGDWLIEKSAFTDTGLNKNGASSNNAIITSATAATQNIIVQYCTFKDIENYGAHLGHGIYHHTGILTWRYNWHYGDNGGWGNSGACVRLSTAEVSSVYSNVFENTGGRRYWGIMHTGEAVHKIYNNVFINNHVPILIDTGAHGLDVKNNIFYWESNDDDDMMVKVFQLTTGDGDWVSDNNIIYNVHGTYSFLWDGNTYTSIADWKTNSSQDANSINADPAMTDPANDDFTLTAQSPCIDSGTPTDYPLALKPGSTWPDGGVTESQWMDGRFDIGAFRYLKYGGG